MSMGAERAEAQPQGEPEWRGEQSQQTSVGDSFDVEAYDEEESAPQRSLGVRLLGALLVAAAVGWIGLCGYALSLAWPGDSMILWTGWIATLSAPLILIALVWLIFGRTARRETERFTAAVAAMRRESQTLEAVLAVVGARLQDNHALLGEQTAKLMSLGEEASDRLGRVTHFLAQESAELERRGQALDNAAASARVDIGVLMGDLPRAEQQARGVAESMKAAGLTAHEQAAALEGHLAALTARGREADEVVGGAAQRLGAQVARIESSASAAAERMDEAASRMNAAVDGSMARAAESVDQARSGIETQGAALLAMIDQSRAAFEQAGAEASRGLAEKLDDAAVKIETLAARLAAQDSASDVLVTRLVGQLAELDAQLASLGQTGDAQHERLVHSLDGVRAAATALRAEIEEGNVQSDAMTSRAQGLSAALDTVTAQLRDQLPAALAGVEAQTERTAQAALAAVPSVEAIQAAAAMAAESLEYSEASVTRQRGTLDALLTTVRDGVGEAEQKLQALGAAVGEADGATAKLIQETGPQLIEALVRVRDAAHQAASHAREAIIQAIPDSVAALADATREAVAEAVTEPVSDQIAEIAGASQRAMAVARQASERLTRQLLTMSETAAAIEDRIAEDQAQRAEKDSESFSRRVSLLIESLNSTAIDVNKLLSNEVADSAWAAYLKGDRGVFTRRAVRLLDSGEAREIQRHYEEEPDFRDHVNRYIHDFEQMLRRVLNDREGASLGVTLLSSDMGKLYVALAQAIERLRR